MSFSCSTYQFTMSDLKISLILFFCILCVNVCLGDDNSTAQFQKPEIYSLHIFSDIKYRFATTLVTSRVKNVHDAVSETIFDVTLPNEAFITNMTVEIEGKIVVGEVKEKEVAKKQYEAAQKRGESAAYIGTKNRETNKFNLAVTVAPKSKVSFNLTYQEILKRKNSMYEQVIYINPGQPVKDMDITVAILESREITFLRVPPLRNDVGDDLADLSTLTVISQPTPKTGKVKFIPSVDQQMAQAKSGMAGQFVVQYDVERDMDAGDVLLVNGYFVHFFAPEGFQPIPHNVLFILDTSGSMSGRKITQLKDAMRSIIKQLGENDKMSIMRFASKTSFWHEEMMDAKNEDVVEDAFRFVDSLRATGGTNIEMALRDGLAFLNDETRVDSQARSPIILFLTDGEATTGVTDNDLILQSVSRVNENEIPIFSLGFGENADYGLVKKMALQNDGFGRKIYEASDAAMQIIGFYNEIAVTLLNDIKFEYLDKPVEDITTHLYSNYFNGSEMIICGRYPTDDNETEHSLNIRISANSQDNTNIVLSGGFENVIQIEDNITKSGDFEEITEKMWAYLTIKQLLDKKVASDDAEAIKNYTKEVLDLSLKYGFVTPLTSMVVTMPTELEKYKIKGAGLADSDRPAREDILTPAISGQRKQNLPSLLSAISHNSRSGYGPRTFNSPMAYGRSGPPSAKKAMLGFQAPLSYDDQFNSPPTKTTKRKKSKPKRRQKVSGLQFPLIIRDTQPLCLKLTIPSSNSSGGTYLLHQSPDGVQVKVVLQPGATMRKKNLRKTIMQHVVLVSNSSTERIKSDSILNGTLPSNGTHWSFSRSQKVSAIHVVVHMNDIQLTVLWINPLEMVLIVDQSSTMTTSHGDGILGQLAAKNFSFVKKQQSRKRKSYALFKLKGKKVLMMEKALEPSYGDVVQKCWTFKKNENRLIDLAAARDY